MHVPDLNVPSFEKLDFDAVVEHAAAEARRVRPRALAGSSFGALIALAVAKMGVAVPLVLIAPALGVADRWRENVPSGDPVTVFNYARNGESQIHRAFFEQMATLRVDDEPPPSRVTAIMGGCDETVPFDGVHRRWREWAESGHLVAGSRLVVIPDGDHGLVSHAPLIGKLIEEAAG